MSAREDRASQSGPTVGSATARVLPARAWGLLWRIAVGALLCQSLVGGILLFGWLMRTVERRVLRHWQQAARGRGAGSGGIDELHLRAWPSFFVREGGLRRQRLDLATPTPERRRLAAVLTAPVRSLGRNLVLGIQGLATTWTLTLPAGGLWAFAWFAGWNNSFQKGYEQAAVGPLLGLAGVVLFVLAMLYVPLAQARQAVTGDWRSFYDLPFFARIWRSAPLSLPLLAGVVSLAALPLNFLKTAPGFFSINHPATLEMSNAELLELLNGYYFWNGALAFLIILGLRLFAGRLYAASLLRVVALEDGDPAHLHRRERQLLHSLGLLTTPARRAARNPLGRRLATTIRPVCTAVAVAGAAGLGLTLVAQIFVSEFLAYHGIRGWLNQPVIQVPWVRHVPAALVEAAAEPEGGTPQPAG